MEIKRAAFAGSWYPSNGSECKEQIEQFLTQKNGAIKSGHFVGGIVPHAGWFFSGSIACRVIASIANSFANSSSAFDATTQKSKSNKVDAIFIFGMHLSPLAKPCIMVNGAWQTPFGDLAVHEPLASEFVKNFNSLNNTINLKIDSPRSFPEENTIELQLPFIKYFFGESAIIPIGTPPSDVAEKIGVIAVETAQKLGLNVVVIGSTDMTHYGSNYGFAPVGLGAKALDWVKNENDPKAIDAMCKMNCDEIIFQGLTNHNLCCAGAVSAAAAASKKMGATKSIPFDYATSYDKNPDSSFVGYSGILFAL